MRYIIVAIAPGPGATIPDIVLMPTAVYIIHGTSASTNILKI